MQKRLRLGVCLRVWDYGDGDVVSSAERASRAIQVIILTRSHLAYSLSSKIVTYISLQDVILATRRVLSEVFSLNKSAR
jgi:hypothetical protein